MKKSRIWYCSLHGLNLYVSEKPISVGRSWKVRAITWRAAGRKLIRKGTIAEALAKSEWEWDNPMQPQFEDSPVKDRKNPIIKKDVKRVQVIRFKEKT